MLSKNVKLVVKGMQGRGQVMYVLSSRDAVMGPSNLL
jgi:hypothetical protein